MTNNTQKLTLCIHLKSSLFVLPLELCESARLDKGMIKIKENELIPESNNKEASN